MDRRCRFCQANVNVTFVDLNSSPLANSLLSIEILNDAEAHYPLHAFVCERCYLVQIEAAVPADDIFSDYLYFSSVSSSWLAHARAYCADMIRRFGFNRQSRVVEVASNDGYLLKNFVSAGIPVLGIEPVANIAEVAEKNSVPTRVMFFGAESARTLRVEAVAADLICANNVLAHVPDINDFVEGFRLLLKPSGVATLEFPHLLNLIQQNQFDTIYHEHFSYLSLLAVERIFNAHGLAVFDVEELPTHGGSLRVYAAHAGARDEGERVPVLRDKEARARLDSTDTYAVFAAQVVRTKYEILEFFLEAFRKGRRVAGYGAPAKGNTLLNYCGIGPEFLPFTVDASPHKQGRYLPGCRIPILHPDALREPKPDYVLILPWNLKDEIAGQLQDLRRHDTKFVTAIPRISIW